MADQWEWTTGDQDGQFWLWYAGEQVAEVVWLRRGRLEHVAMQRVQDALNRPAPECVPPSRPRWSFEFDDHGCPMGRWDWSFRLDGDRPAIVVSFRRPLSRPENWMRRIADGLDAGRGLDTVTVDDGRAA